MHAALAADGTVLVQADRRVREQQEKLAAAGKEVVSKLRSLDGSLSSGKSSQAAMLRDAAGAVRGVADTVASLLAEAESAFVDAESRLTAIKTSWDEAIRPLEKELQRLQQELQTDTLDPGRLMQLVKERTELEPLLTDLEVTEQQVSVLRQQRTQLLRDLRTHRRQENAIRREKCDQVNDRLKNQLLLKVEFKGQKAEYRESLASLFKGSGITGDALDRLVAPDATDGAALVEAARGGADGVQKAFGLSVGAAQKLVKWLSDSEERLFELETVVPADSVLIELVVDGQARSLDRLSIGQRATAILLLIFALEGRLLVLDQARGRPR